MMIEGIDTDNKIIGRFEALKTEHDKPPEDYSNLLNRQNREKEELAVTVLKENILGIKEVPLSPSEGQKTRVFGIEFKAVTSSSTKDVQTAVAMIAGRATSMAPEAGGFITALTDDKGTVTLSPSKGKEVYFNKFAKDLFAELGIPGKGAGRS